MTIERKLSRSPLDYWFPIFWAAIVFVTLVVWLFDGGWWAAGVFLFGVLISIASFQRLDAASVGLVLRFGRRVVVREKINCSRWDEAMEECVDVSAEEAEALPADEVRCEVIPEYLTRPGGWAFPLPIIERLVEISMRQWRMEINAWQEIDGVIETREQYQARAESFRTFENAHLIPELTLTWRVINPGLAFEFDQGFKNGFSEALEIELHDLVLSSARQVLGPIELTKIFTRVVPGVNGEMVAMSEGIREDILKTPNWNTLGIELGICKLEDIEPSQDAEDLLDEYEDIKKQEFERKQQKVLAEQNYEVQTRWAEQEAKVTRTLADADRYKREQEAVAERAFLAQQIAGFVGKEVNEITEEDAALYAQFVVAERMAESMDENSTVILPPSELANLGGNFYGLFEGMKTARERAKKPAK